MPLPERLLVDADLADPFGLPPLQSTLDGPLHNAVDLVPTQLQQSRYSLLARRFQPFDRQRLEQRRKAARRLRPRQLDRLHAMVPAFRARRLGMEDRLILAGVQVSPSPLWLMVIQFACRAALRTRPIDHLVMSEVDVDLAAFQFQIYRIHKPRGFNPQNAPIQFVILHGGIVACCQPALPTHYES